MFLNLRKKTTTTTT